MKEAIDAWIKPIYPAGMRALSVAGAFGYMICDGSKIAEYRTWPTRHRGNVFIHIPSSRDWDDSFAEFGINPLKVPKSSIIGMAELVDCEKDPDDPEGIGHLHFFENPLLLPTPILNVMGARNYWQPRDGKTVQAFNQAWLQIREMLGCDS